MTEQKELIPSIYAHFLYPYEGTPHKYHYILYHFIMGLHKIMTSLYPYFSADTTLHCLDYSPLSLTGIYGDFFYRFL